MTRVTSASAPEIAAYRSVGDDGALRRMGLFVAEGRLVVRRVVEDARYEVVSALVTPAALAALGGVLAGVLPFPVHVADQSVVNGVTGVNFHRGCLALVRRPAAALEVRALAPAQRLFALEGVSNPDNVGGVFRVTGALGADGVLLDTDSADPLYRKAIRTSMAATLRVPYARVESWAAARDALGPAFTFVALTPAADATPLGAFDARGRRLVLLLGAEGDGLRRETLEFADVRVRIPVDSRFDSLNVVVAAGIALYALQANPGCSSNPASSSSSRA